MTNRSRATPLAWAAALAVAGLTGRPAMAVFTSKPATMPPYVQDGFGPAGDLLPFGGQEFCCPTATAMSLSYLGANGYGQLGPAAPTTADGLNLDRILAGLMQTDALNGTASNALITSAIATYLNAKGIASNAFSVLSYQDPTVAQLAQVNQPGTTVNLVCGYYVPSGSTYVRNGGHCVSLVNQGVNAQGQTSNSTVVIDNPYPGAFAPVSDVPGNTLEYLNTVPTTGSLTSVGNLVLDHAQFPNYWGTTQTVIETAIAVTINTSQLSVNHPAVAAWSPAANQSVNTDGGTFTIAAPVEGSGGLSLTTWGTVELQAGDTATGANTVTGGTLRGDAATTVPFGIAPITLDAGTLRWVPANINSNVADQAATGVNDRLTFADGSTLAVDRNGNPSVTLRVGGETDGSTPNLGRVGTGTLVIAPAGGTAGLGATETVLLGGSNGNLPPTTSSGVVYPYIVGADAGAAAAGTFLTYTSNGGFAAYPAYVESANTSITNSYAGTVYDVTNAQTVPAGTTAVMQALRVSGTITGGAGTAVSVGQGAGGQAGVILNGGSIGTATLSFGTAEGVVYTGGAGGTISAGVQGSGGLTTFGPGTLTLSGNNTYTGTTNINSGVLRAASPAGSATGAGPVNVRENGTLQVTGTAGGGLTTVYPGGTLLMSGGTLAGALYAQAGSYLLGQGTINGSVTVSGTIGSPATDFGTAAAPYAGVENLLFTNGVSMGGTTIYDWRLNALDAAPADAGTNWSLLRFTGPDTSSNQVDLGTQGNAVHYTLDLGSNVPDPNTNTPFWMAAHQWDVATSANGFYWVWYSYNFPTYADGYFSLSTDANYHNVYVNYTPTGSTWAAAGNGTWTATADWSSWVPNSTNAIATFGPASAARTVTLDAPQTAGTLNFSSAAGTTIAGSNPLTLSGSAGPATVSVTAGANTLAIPVTLANGLNVTAAASAGLTLAGPVTGSGTLTANGPGKLTVAATGSVGVPLVAAGPVVFAGHGSAGGILAQVVPSVAINAGGSVSLTAAGTGHSGNRTLLVAGSLTFAGSAGAWAGKLDLADNDLDVPGGSLAALTSAAAQGLGGGSWNGSGGIVSTVAAADPQHLTGVGVIQNATAIGGAVPLYASFDGRPVSASDVLVRYTFYGDANLDGVVNAADYVRVDAGYVLHLTGWQNGDLNYDGVVDGSDYTLIDTAFNLQDGRMGTPNVAATLATAAVAAATPVPEPAAVAMLAVAAGALRGRSRRRR